MRHLTACKISVCISVLKWKDFLSYLWINIAKKIISFLIQFKNERLTELFKVVRCHIL